MFQQSTAVPSLKVRTIAAGLLLAFGASAQAAPSSGSSKTAQGIYVQMTTPTELAIEQNIQYRFDPVLAATYFTNALDTSVAVGTPSCKGNAADCAKYMPSTAPQAPMPLMDVLGDNACVWMQGGLLSGTTYKQTATTTVVDGKKSFDYVYTYSYKLTPSTEPVAPKTAWVFDRMLGDENAAALDIAAKIAGESVVVSNQFPAPGKFSFSMMTVDPLSGLPMSRITDLVYTVTDQNGVAVALPVSSEPVTGVDLEIKSYNGGTNGNAALLAATPASMKDILNNDATPNNDNGGADGSAMAFALVQPGTFTLPAGDYTINLRGTVKGNAASANVLFNIEKKTKITYVRSACGQ